MDADEVYAAIARALRRAEEARDRGERELAELRARFEQVVQILTGAGVLAAGHARLIDRVAAKAAEGVPARVRLRQFVDKHQVVSPEIDCASRLPLCQARCCSFSFELTTQDLDDGVRWEVDSPYLILHEQDGYCAHYQRAGGGCNIYDRRPAACRTFDCRQDARIWIDFDRRIPAP